MLIIEEIKSSVHRLANKLQLVMGNLELDRYDKALQAAIDTRTELWNLSQLVKGNAVYLPLNQPAIVELPVMIAPVRTMLDTVQLSEKEMEFLEKVETDSKTNLSVIVPYYKALVAVSFDVDIIGVDVKKPSTSEPEPPATPPEPDDVLGDEAK